MIYIYMMEHLTDHDTSWHIMAELSGFRNDEYLSLFITTPAKKCDWLCGDRTPGRSLQSPTPKPLGHKGTWMTQSLTLGWFVTLLPPFEIRAPWLGPLPTKAGSFHSQANPGYHCHQCNGPCRDRTPGCSLQSPTPKPLGHKGTWTTQSLMLGWFVTWRMVILPII